MLQGHIPTQCCEVLAQAVSPFYPLVHHERCGPCIASTWSCGRSIYFWDSLPTIEKMSTLVWWPVVFGMVMNWGRSPEMFFKPFPKSPCRLPCVLLITLWPVTPIPVYHSTFLCDVTLVLWGHQEASDGITSLKVDLDPQFITNVFKHLLNPLCRVVPYVCCCVCSYCCCWGPEWCCICGCFWFWVC